MTLEPQMGLTFEQVWATIQRIAEKHEELVEKHEETERRFQELAEQHKETERFLKESKAETDKTITKMNRELNQAIGKLGNRFGELIEHLVSPNLLKKFNALGYAFGKSSPRVKYEDIHTGETIAEVDVLLENGGCVLAVEIKTDPTIEDVKDHVKRMETLRRHADLLNDRRDYLGAIAGGIMNDNVKRYALKQGFYVLEQSGDTVNIAATPETWKPKKW